MTVYQAVVDASEANASHSVILEQVGTDKSVLDVGCATGYLAEALAARGCTVSGIEVDADAAELARPHLETLVVADLESTDLADAFPGAQFDVVVFGDVLEHLSDPLRALRSAVTLLAPGGSVVLSVPNVAHGSVRLALLAGEWNYTDRGLLDSTHVRFFTYETLTALVEEAGFVVTDARGTVADALATEVDVPTGGLPVEVVDWVRARPHADVYQFVLRAEPGARPLDETAARPQRVVPAIELEPVHDYFHQQAELARAERHQLLTSRDHVIGLEAETATARRKVKALEAELSRLHEELHRVSMDRGAIYESSTWRAGRAILLPVTALKKVVRG